MSEKRVVVIGAGPGALTASMLLASRGLRVDVFEAKPVVGGRNAPLRLGDFTFELGPTFLMMRFYLEEVFGLSGRRVEDYLDIRSLDPLYRLVFADGRELRVTSDHDAMKRQLEALVPGTGPAYQRWLDYERIKFDHVTPCLKVPYSSLRAFATRRFVRALPYLDAHKSLFTHLGNYFENEQLRICFTFQAKYLGMSPWSCPGTFSLVPYIEHAAGIHHPMGGLHRISQAMAKVIEEHGGRIHLSSPVRRLLVENGRTTGVELEDGSREKADAVVLGSDFGYGLTHLIPESALRRWTPRRLGRKKLSCSTFMLYLGLDKLYADLPHHNIVFAEDYKRNVEEIADKLVLSDDPSFYMQNASVTDPGLAPPGMSTLYVLVPVPNNRSGIDWDAQKAPFTKKVLGLLESRGGLAGLRSHIVESKVLTPLDWERDMHVYRGATFNLAHNIGQMLYFRPHNRFDDIDGLYLVGGGTHPGSGLPTIFESGRISANLILERFGMERLEGESGAER
ncbi:MAG TPA: phytoene desaturase [Myxococcales bacterium]|nr:phytoene desaturase [Myxococcales bacterium]